MTVVALDLGGVIVDIDHGRVERALGIDRPALERAFFDEALHDRVTVGDVDGGAFAREAARRLGVAPADHAGVERVAQAWSLVVDVTAAGRALVEDLLAAGAAVHLWTNTDPIHLERMLAQLPAGVVARTASFRLGAMKPQPSYYERARAEGEPVIFLDDLAKNVAAAAAAGIDARVVSGAAEARAALVALGLVPGGR